MNYYRFARGEAGVMKVPARDFGGPVVATSDRVTLRRTNERDLDFVLGLERDPMNAPNLAYWSREEHANTLRDARWAHLVVEEKTTGERIGYVILNGVRDESRNVQLKRIVVREQNHGWGRATLQVLKHWVFDDLHAHRFWLDVKTFNLNAQHLYESEGFQKEGVMRECVKRGDEYHSVVLLSLLEAEYRRAQAKTE